MRFYKIPDFLDGEIEELVEYIALFKNGRLSGGKLKVKRVPFGVYEQRKDGTYMVRVRCNAGGITPYQFEKVGELANQYGSGFVHVTTRQEVQIHDVDIDSVIPVIKGLREVELSSRGGGGNTVRNIMASFDSGLFDNDVFDVTPYVYALANKLIADKESWNLPRKYKISFSSKKGINNANTHIQDLGFVAKIQDGLEGFKVYATGGMGSGPELGVVLHEFIEGNKIYVVAEALKRVFSQYGNRKNKHKARLRWLVKEIGFEKLKKLYEAEFSSLEVEPGSLLTVEKEIFYNSCGSMASDVPAEAKGNAMFMKWYYRYVKEQKQKGLFGVGIPLRFGNIRSEGVENISKFLKDLSDDTIRFTMNQNIYLRNIPGRYLPDIYEISRSISDLTDKSSILGNGIACTGANTCRLGICLPRGLSNEIIKKLDCSKVETDRLSHLKINISGCPNSCGQHMVADIGFFGKVGKNGQNSYPAYNVVLGASAKEGSEKLADTVASINARNLPVFLEEILVDYQRKLDIYKSYTEYIEDVGKEFVKKTAEKYQIIPSFDDDKNYYYDWGASEAFSLAGRGQGECSAGLFDLIDFDLKSAEDLVSHVLRNNVDERSIYDLVLYSSRALLITKGIEPKTDSDVFKYFREEFIDGGYIDSSLENIVDNARVNNLEFLLKNKNDAVKLLSEVKNLYASMDNSLKFLKDNIMEKDLSDERSYGIRKKDLRGVLCPMNFVKTKIELSYISIGDYLEILLDDGEPVKNVPRSVEGEGHKIIEQEQINNYWRVLIQKQE